MTKRLLDLLGSILGMILLSPIGLLICLILFVANNGRIFFTQNRVGLHNRQFKIMKFQTMRPTSEGPKFSASDDSRITSIGRVLRYTKLDELPQLLNILTGQMSFVGPRPEVPEFVEMWPAEAREVILSVPPGLTDPASIKYRDEGRILAAQSDPQQYYIQTLLPAKVKMYVEYVERCSLRYDLELIVRTVVAVVVPSNDTIK